MEQKILDKNDISDDLILSNQTKDLDNDSLNSSSNNYESQMNLETEILYYIEQRYPDYFHNDITKPKKKKIEHMSNLLDEYKEIGKDPDKHNLKWAFKKATTDFNFEELQKVQGKTDCFIAYDDVVCAVRDRTKAKINNFSRRLTFLSMTVDFIDISISVLIVILFYLLTELGNKIFNTIVLGTIFILSIAFTRVFLERFAIGPFVNGYGWKLFNRTIQSARNETIRLNAIFLVLMESITRKESIETRLELIRKQKQEVTSRKPFTLPVLNTPKPTD